VFSITVGPPFVYSVKKGKIARVMHERKKTLKMIRSRMYRHKIVLVNVGELDVHRTNFIAQIIPDYLFIIYQTVSLDF
jgi:hypothetical protein